MAKTIKKWQPENFELEMTTHWTFPNRGDWATHDAKWRGNWSPYIPRNIMLRYSQEGDLVLDQFAGGGTTLVEAKLLNRDIIGVDVNDIALERCHEKTAFELDGANGKVYIKKGDARNLFFIPSESIDLICTHPPYADIIKYSEDTNLDYEGCLSVPGFDAVVERSNSIVIEYTNIFGEKCIEEYTGFVARAIQHEYDHLQGIVYTDIADMKTFTTRDNLIEANEEK